MSGASVALRARPETGAALAAAYRRLAGLPAAGRAAGLRAGVLRADALADFAGFAALAGFAGFTGLAGFAGFGAFASFVGLAAFVALPAAAAFLTFGALSTFSVLSGLGGSVEAFFSASVNRIWSPSWMKVQTSAGTTRCSSQSRRAMSSEPAGT
jgi:hypothetical protein